MWMFVLPVIALGVFGLVHLLRARRMRRREEGMVRAELRSFARRAEDPALLGEMRFTAPLRCDEDRAHDTMFTVRHGSHGLSFILDISRARVRWWVLAEWYAPDGTRSARFEATFVEAAIPTGDIQILLKAARGELKPSDSAEAVTASETPVAEPPKEPAVDPFEAAPEPAAQA